MNKYEMFIYKFLYFDELVRSNKGLDDIAFQEVCESLKELGPLFRKNNSVPLDVANIFIDMYSSIESSADRHPPEMREKIRKVMRFSGPRMIIYAPKTALWHMLCTIKERILK